MHPRVAEALERAGVPYRLYRHADFPGPISSPADFAQALGYAPERITRSLFIRCQHSGEYGLLVGPSTRRANLRRVAQHMGCRRVQLVEPAVLLAILGYPPGGVSPLGAGLIPIFIDEGLLDFATVLIGAGEAGVEIEIAPADLKRITGATALDIGDR
ncbi:MAG: YbaK/EbsC family protein [Chloroflexia bacterium]